MAHNEPRRRRERPPPEGSEGHSQPHIRYFDPKAEPLRHRHDGNIGVQQSREAGPPRGSDYDRRQGHDDDADEASRPEVPIIRRREDARSDHAPRYQRQRSPRRARSPPAHAERVIIENPPTAFPYAASSDSESENEGDDRARRPEARSRPRRLNTQSSDRDVPRPPSINRDEVIINPVVYEDAKIEDYRIYRPMSPVFEDVDTFDDFQFAFPAEEPSKDAEMSDLETPTTESESTQKPERPPSNTMTAPGIYSSTYSGTAELGAQHDVNLTIMYDPKGQKQPLFRWLHVDVSRHIQFTDAERAAIANLRAEIKRQCVKTRYNPQGAKVGYMEPKCIQVPVQATGKKASESSHAAHWICIPYFSLHQYSGSPSTSNTALFPAQTLLQSQYSRSSQQRDMDQAVCQLGQVPRGDCFHISQMWCLIVGNSVLITCSTMQQSELQGACLKVNTEPSQVGASGKILVSYGGAVMWSLTTKECPTWFAFIAHFRAFWPRCLEFWHKDRRLSAKNWGKVLKLAEGRQGDVKLKLKIAPESPRVFLKPNTSTKTASAKSPEQTEDLPEYLHVFTLLPKSAESSGDTILKELYEQLSAAEKFLTEQTSYSAQRGYKQCRLMARDGVNEYLTNLAPRIDEKANDTLRRLYEERIDVFNMADMLFQLFFPLTFHGPTTGKYWGALNKLMKMPELDGDGDAISAPLTEFKNALWQLTRDIQSFQSIMSFAGKEDRATIELPRELVTAWLHIVFGLIYSSHTTDWFSHMTRARSLMKDGMQKMIQGISSQNLLDKAVMLPTEIMSLITLNLLQDDVGKYDNICDTYSLYLNSLDTDITTKHSDRTYQHRLDLVKQEMTAIKRNLARQRSIIAMLRNRTSITDGNFMVRYGEEMPTQMRRLREWENGGRSERGGPRHRVPGYRHYGVAEDRTIEPGVYDQAQTQFLTDLDAASKLSATDTGGFRSLFLADCANLVEQREYEFRRNTEYAEDLERETTYKMEWTKDRQENAIYAFTLVTIIFLPLSAISSIFGMNTNDIRNMDFDQWLYWAIALPVTVIIIVAGLWWMDELGNTTDWLLGARKRSSEYGKSSISGAGRSGPAEPVVEYDSIGRSSDEMPVVAYRRARHRRRTRRSYAADVDDPIATVPLPPRRRNSFYKY
ncbi:hypothetical protein LI328DRAFT_158084 [Trichoderma asperelloides]|nr:hypothetical protein LI328DRAFT_158084 [Trichoderma asperelloides]